MNAQLSISDVRDSLGDLVNQAYYGGKIFGVSKGDKPMGVIVGAPQWKEIVRVIEEHSPGLADTLAIMADPNLQRMLDEGDREIARGNVIPWEQVERELAAEEQQL